MKKSTHTLFVHRPKALAMGTGMQDKTILKNLSAYSDSTTLCANYDIFLTIFCLRDPEEKGLHDYSGDIQLYLHDERVGTQMCLKCIFLDF